MIESTGTAGRDTDRALSSDRKRKILWIVEDERRHRKLILDAIEREFPDTFDAYVVTDLGWPEADELPNLEPASSKLEVPVRQPGSPENLPHIVVLDLLLADAPVSLKDRRKVPEEAAFRGCSFYYQLRDVERTVNTARSQVIVYSQHRGIPFTESFVEARRDDDNHFDAVGVKSPELLVQKLREALKKVETEE